MVSVQDVGELPSVNIDNIKFDDDTRQLHMFTWDQALPKYEALAIKKSTLAPTIWFGNKLEARIESSI